MAVETVLGDETDAAPYIVRVLRKEGHGSQTVRTPISSDITIDTEADVEPFLAQLTERIRSLPDVTAAGSAALIPTDPAAITRLFLEALENDPELSRAVEAKLKERSSDGDDEVPSPSEAMHTPTVDEEANDDLLDVDSADQPVTDPAEAGPFMRGYEYGAREGREGEAGLGEDDDAELGDDEGDDPLRPDGEGDVQPPGAGAGWDADPGREGLPDEGLGDGSGDRPASSWGDQ